MRKFRDHPGLYGASLFVFATGAGAAEGSAGEATAGAGVVGARPAGEGVESARLSPAREEVGAGAGVPEAAFEVPKVVRELDLMAGEEGAGEAVGADAAGVEVAAAVGVAAGVGDEAVVDGVGGGMPEVGDEAEADAGAGSRLIGVGAFLLGS
jgi:hypothetical protein